MRHDPNKKNIETIIENSLKVLNVVSRIRKQQKESIEHPKHPKEKEACFNFWIFKVRKTSLVVAALGLLVLILTLFCMKQQNDYALLMNGYYIQGVEMREMQEEVDSLEKRK